MGFLDNSGDIILDAVLTDLGRKRLAEGNGSFQITKFAFGDDEIDYGLYDKNNTNGTAYYDISILQTPVLEAFTNNASSMKSALISYSQNNLLYLPIIKLGPSNSSLVYSGTPATRMILVDQTTTEYMELNGQTLIQGFFNGYQPQNGSNFFETDQGLDTTELSSQIPIPAGLEEGQYNIQIDQRLGSIVTVQGGGDGDGAQLTPVSVDDDNIATYLFSVSGADGIVREISTSSSSILGPRGTRCKFKIKASLELETSTFLFNQLGTQGSDTITNGSNSLTGTQYKFVDSNVRIVGVTTGYSLDIPIRFVKKTA